MNLSYNLFCVPLFLMASGFSLGFSCPEQEGRGLGYRLCIIMLTKTTSFNNKNKLDIKGKRMFKNMEKCEIIQGSRYT